MRLSLADLKKTVSRRGGEPYLTPYLLRPGELEAPIDALIGLHESWLGRPRATFPDDRPAELIGDYRLARCLLACLGEWYEWRAPAWPVSADAAEVQALAQHGLTSPTDLRLALYDHVNGAAGGYLPGPEREAALDAFATVRGLRRPTLDTLLALDADDHAELTRLVDQPPSVAELAARYNQRAVEALLYSASNVEWHIPADAAGAASAGLGTIVKRVCFLARSMGVQYDIAFDHSTAAHENPGFDLQLRRVAERPHPYALSSLDDARRPLTITLYGPQEVTGAANQYGDRLARLCRALLGYRRRRAGKAALSASGLTGAARVYLHGRPLTFLLDDRLLALMDPAASSSTPQPVPAASPIDTEAAAFDSGLERALHEEFSALERAGEAHGWRLEREPEPLIVGETILVPDFAVTRGARRVYLEIAGYWRPDYRERKVRKLNALGDSVAQVVAAPTAARADFAALDPRIPILWYTSRVSASSLLALLDRVYDDFAQRLAALDPAQISAEVQQRGCVPSAEAPILLHSYTRGEIAATIAHIAGARADAPPSMQWIDGLGLCSVDWLASLRDRIVAHMAATPEGRLSLADLTRQLPTDLPEARGLTASAVEALASHAGLAVTRSSIFDVEVALGEPSAPESSASAALPLTALHRPAQPQRPVRRKQQQKSQGSAYTATSIFSILPSERPGDHDTKPDTPSRARDQMPGDAGEGGFQ